MTWINRRTRRQWQQRGNDALDFLLETKVLLGLGRSPGASDVASKEGIAREKDPMDEVGDTAWCVPWRVKDLQVHPAEVQVARLCQKNHHSGGAEDHGAILVVRVAFYSEFSGVVVIARRMVQVAMGVEDRLEFQAVPEKVVIDAIIGTAWVNQNCSLRSRIDDEVGILEEWAGGFSDIQGEQDDFICRRVGRGRSTLHGPPRWSKKERRAK